MSKVLSDTLSPWHDAVVSGQAKTPGPWLPQELVIHVHGLQTAYRHQEALCHTLHMKNIAGFSSHVSVAA